MQGELLVVRIITVMLDLVSSVPNQDIGWEEHLLSDTFCVEWDAKL